MMTYDDFGGVMRGRDFVSFGGRDGQQSTATALADNNSPSAEGLKL
jgi:hypothetical protein